MVNSATVKKYDRVDPNMADDPFMQVTRLFVYFLQNLFRTAPQGSGMRWSPEQEDTEVMITGEKPLCDALEKLPHITCILGSGRWGGTSLDQLQHVNFNTGERKHTDLMSTTMAYHCQSSNGLVSRRMAWQTSYYTNVFCRILQRAGELHHVDAKHDIGPESPPTAYTGPLVSTELVSVVVTVPFHWQVQWKVRKPAEVFRGIKMMLNTSEVSSMYSAGRLKQIRPPMVNGIPVQTVPLVTEPPEVTLTQEVREDSYT